MSKHGRAYGPSFVGEGVAWLKNLAAPTRGR